MRDRSSMYIQEPISVLSSVEASRNRQWRRDVTNCNYAFAVSPQFSRLQCIYIAQCT